MKPRILMIDDDPSIAFSFTKFLNSRGYDVVTAGSLEEAREALRLHPVNAMILDQMLPDGDGIDFLTELREGNETLPIIFITAHGNVNLAVEAMRKGADNFMVKPVNMSGLELFLSKSVELGRLRQTDRISQRTKRNKIEMFLEERPVMKSILDYARLAAYSDTIILIHGETGTGKGVLARWIHENSARKNNPFVPVNCAGLKDELLASELFGHAKGAFTSAVQEKQGLVEFANNGTLFLDEISSMSMQVQAELLKVIEDRTYRRLGETRTRISDFRLICASNQDLEVEVDAGNFRSDLYYRINVFPINMASMRDMKEDLKGLIRQILFDLNAPEISLNAKVMKLLSDYSWPGNIRELNNVLERAMILAKGKMPSVEHFPGLRFPKTNVLPKTIKPLEQVVEEYITMVMERCGNDTIKASHALGISRQALYRRLRKMKHEAGNE